LVHPPGQSQAGNQGTGDGNTLLFAARKLVWFMTASFGQADHFKKLIQGFFVMVGFFPSMITGRRIFSSAVRVGSRLKNWKIKPTL